MISIIQYRQKLLENQADSSNSVMNSMMKKVAPPAVSEGPGFNVSTMKTLPTQMASSPSPTSPVLNNTLGEKVSDLGIAKSLMKRNYRGHNAKQEKSAGLSTIPKKGNKGKGPKGAKLSNTLKK